LNWVRNLGEGAKLHLKLGANGLRNRGLWREFDYTAGPLGRDATVWSRTSERGLSATGKYSRRWRSGHTLSAGWRCPSRTSRVSRRAGRCTPACVGKGWKRPAKAIPSRRATNRSSVGSPLAQTLYKLPNSRDQLRLALSNVLGQDYIADSRYTDGNGTSRRTTVFPGTPMGRVTLEARFRPCRAEGDADPTLPALLAQPVRNCPPSGQC
jgi:hypothetical protein